MGRETTPGDIVADRLRQIAKHRGIPADEFRKRYVFGCTLHRLGVIFGTKAMLKGSLAAWMADQSCRFAPDIDLHLQDTLDDIESRLREELQKTFYDSDSPSGLLEDRVEFASVKAVKVKRADDGSVLGTKLKVEARLGGTKIPFDIDLTCGFGSVSSCEVRRFPPIFKGLPEALVLCQPVADRMADKVRVMFDHGMMSTRVKDLHDIAHEVRAGRFDAEAVGRALWLQCESKGISPGAVPACVTADYGRAHQPTWKAWLGENPAVDDGRTLAELVAEIRQPVEQACARALRHADRVRVRPGLRLVA